MPYRVFVAFFLGFLALISCRARQRPTARNGLTHQRCAVITPEGPRQWSVGNTEIRRNGITAKDSYTGPGVVAFVGGPHLHRPEVDARVVAIGRAFALARPRVLVVLGGFDASVDVVDAWLRVVLPENCVALLLPGDNDDVDHFHDLVNALQERHPAVIDATYVRLYATRSVELVTLPGVVSPGLMRREGNACVLHNDDPVALSQVLESPHAPRLLVTLSAPLQTGVYGIDRGVLATHIGSPAIATLVKSMQPRGVVSLIPRESAATLSDITGEHVLANDVGETPFALSVGSCGSEPVETAEGALLGPVGWIVRVMGTHTVIERIE
jgi:hypothetical protein